MDLQMSIGLIRNIADVVIHFLCNSVFRGISPPFVLRWKKN